MLIQQNWRASSVVPSALSGSDSLWQRFDGHRLIPPLRLVITHCRVIDLGPLDGCYLFVAHPVESGHKPCGAGPVPVGGPTGN
jgi:hypothetical protein